ncbi:MAG: hypothetical protein HFH32_12130 [Eubacterium sp.]|jgi:beta-lactamase regulating signal transducer with metallopeptidase domain|nr:hypothetical protein [Eubacterium sp.]
MDVWSLTEQVFLKLFNMSITAGYCVLAVLLFRAVLRRQPKIYSYLLWVSVFFRLACPVSVKSPFSLLKISTQTVPQDIGMHAVPHIQSGSVRADRAVNRILSQEAFVPKPYESVNPMQVYLALAACAWAAVLLVLVLVSAVSYVRLARKLRGASLLEAGVYEKEGICTPFVCGVLHPRIYLPKELSQPGRQFVLEHEKTHVRRRDYLVKQAAFFICCVHWFNPLAWLAFVLMCRDMEMSCDESVIRKLGQESRKAYSAALLSVASGRKIILAGPLFCGEGGIRQRIANVLRYKKKALWLSVLLAAAVTAVTAGLLFSPGEEIQAGQDSGGEGTGTRQEQPGTDENMGTQEQPGTDADKNTGTQQQPGTDADENGRGPRTGYDGADDMSRVVQYEGYLDESPYQEWRDACPQPDFDFDGKTDRIYRTVSESTVSYRIEFGNGDRLELGESDSFFMVPEISSAHVPYGDSVMILSAGQHPEDTDPLDCGDISLYAKLGKDYAKISLPHPDGPSAAGTARNRAGYFITESYDSGRGMIKAEIRDAGLTLELKPGEAAEDGFMAESRTAFDARFISCQGETCIALYQNAGGKWRQDIVVFVLKVHPTHRSGMEPFDLELVFAGWEQELEPDGLTPAQTADR